MKRVHIESLILGLVTAAPVFLRMQARGYIDVAVDLLLIAIPASHKLDSRS
jgi:hypothetical protein